MSKEVQIDVSEWINSCSRCGYNESGKTLKILLEEDGWINIFSEGVSEYSSNFLISLTKKDAQRLVEVLSESLSELN